MINTTLKGTAKLFIEKDGTIKAAITSKKTDGTYANAYLFVKLSKAMRNQFVNGDIVELEQAWLNVVEPKDTSKRNYVSIFINKCKKVEA